MNELIRLENVTKTYAAFEGAFRRSGVSFNAVEDVSLAITQGVSLGIVGESGSGKTTLAKIIGRMIESDGGRLLYKGEDPMESSATAARHRRNVQMVFQDPNSCLNPKLTIFSALKDGIHRHITQDKQEIRAFAVELMKHVGLEEEHLDRYPHEFSGGQRQRISIARALSLKPELIIADEPVSSLDVSVQAQILNLMKRLKQDDGVTFVMISHDLAVVSFLCEELVVMYKGKIVERGKTQDVLQNPQNEYTKALLKASTGQAITR